MCAVTITWFCILPHSSKLLNQNMHSIERIKIELELTFLKLNINKQIIKYYNDIVFDVLLLDSTYYSLIWKNFK